MKLYCAYKGFARLVKMIVRLVHPGYYMNLPKWQAWKIEFLCTLLSYTWILDGLKLNY